MPQTKFVVGKALKIGLKPIVCVNKVDKSDARPSEVVNEVFDLFAALDATDEQLDFPIIYGSAKQGWMAAAPEGPKDNMAPLFDLVLEARRTAEGRRRRLPHARHPARGQSLPRAHHHRPRLLRFGQDQRAGQGARPRRRSGRTGPGLENPRLPGHRALADRGGGRRRHRRHRRPGKVQRRRHSVQPGGGRAPARASHRSADPVDDLLRQRQPAGRHRGRQGDEPRHSRPALQGGRGQCRAQGRGGREFRRLCRFRARRIAARHPHRDHAPRGLRTRRFASEGAEPPRRQRRDCWSRSRKS